MNRILVKYRALVAAVSAASVFAVTATDALATGQDYSGVTTGVTDNIASAVTTALPIAGTILGFFVGYRVVKRIVR